MSGQDSNFKGFADSAIMERLDVRLPGIASAPLAGLSFAVKDMFDIEGRTAAFGCPDWLAGQKPAVTTAPAVVQMLLAGAHLTANAICDELAFSLDGVNVHYGTPLNPQDIARIPGGSSSGPATLVASDYVDFALGTDTAGSVRVPASYCGIFGLRPSHGAISLEGVRALGPTFDTVGIMSRALPVMQKVAACYFADASEHKVESLVTIEDAFALLDETLQPYMMAALDKVRGLMQNLHLQMRAQQNLAVAGVDTGELVKQFAAIRGLEAWNLYGRWLEEEKPQLGAATEARLRACSQAGAEAAGQAVILRNQLREHFSSSTEVYILPTTANLAPLLTSTQEELDTNRGRNLKLCSIASFIGLPQLTMPLSAIDPGLKTPPTMPGLSLVGPIGSELTLLTLASHLTA